MTFLNSFYLPFSLLIIPVGLSLAGFFLEHVFEEFFGNGRPVKTFLYGACWGSILSLAIVATR